MHRSPSDGSLRGWTPNPPQSTDKSDWVEICRSEPVFGDALEARIFARRNVPERRRVPSGITAALLALEPASRLWDSLDFHACDDLTFGLARVVVARQSKLKSFVAVSEHGEYLLKQWPGKDAVQALAVWWLAARLVDGHCYTEPELYAVIEAHCVMRPDFAVVRKEMCRRGYLQPPRIVENDDRTTTTSYEVDVDGMRAPLRGEWRSKGVF